MNAFDMARTAYAPSTAPIRSASATEYDLFARITRRIHTLLRTPNRSFTDLAEALHDNRRYWSRLATDVADADNGLPADLRARIFFLYEFTNQHTSKVLAGDADPVVLIEINMAVMRGLHAQGADQ